MEDGIFQRLRQQVRVVILVNEAVHALGDEPGGAGVFRHDGRLAEDQALGDEGGHGVIAGGAHHAGALVHQGFDLRALQPLAVEHGVRVVLHEGVHGVLDVFIGGLAHKEEGRFLPHFGLQQADGVAEDVLAFAGLEGAYGDEQRPPARIGDVVDGEGLLRVVRQAVDELFDGKIRPDGVHGGGGVGADGADLHIVFQRFRDLVRDEGVACKGVVQPPQHRHEGSVQGAHGGGFHHRVGQHEVGTGGKAPQRRVHHAVAAGDDGGPGVQEQRQ